MITVIENFVDKQLQDDIEGNLLSGGIGWYYNASTVDPRYGEGDIFKNVGTNPHQFSIPVDQSSQIFPHIAPFFENISKHYKSDIQVLRAKFNLLNQSSSTEFNYPHIDTTEPDFITLLYYVNDSDGDTFVFNEKYPSASHTVTIQDRISPKKGKAVLFDSSIYHSSSNPTSHNVRVVLSIVFRLVKTTD